MASYPTTTDDEREAAVEAAAKAVSRGLLVVLPTDTVYGVGADAFDKQAVLRLLVAKGRTREMPPPVLISSPTTADGLARDLPEAARRLMERFWPGPLTLIAHEQPSLAWDLGETGGTVAMRMPDHEVALAVLERTGPMAVSSANVTGEAAATNAAEAERMLGYEVDVYVDAGETPGSVPSTIVDVTREPPHVVRHGVISVDELNSALEDLGITVVDEG